MRTSGLLIALALVLTIALVDREARADKTYNAQNLPELTIQNNYYHVDGKLTKIPKVRKLLLKFPWSYDLARKSQKQFGWGIFLDLFGCFAAAGLAGAGYGAYVGAHNVGNEKGENLGLGLVGIAVGVALLAIIPGIILLKKSKKTLLKAYDVYNDERRAILGESATLLDDVPKGGVAEPAEPPVPAATGNAVSPDVPPPEPSVATADENTPDLCQDGEDNDQDGQTDCADQDCGQLAFCAQPPSPPPAAVEDENTSAKCKDGQDNDGDGLVDCADEDCSKYFKFCVKGGSGTTENSPAKCKDGVDNDGDGLVDCEDQDCGLLKFCVQ